MVFVHQDTDEDSRGHLTALKYLPFCELSKRIWTEVKGKLTWEKSEFFMLMFHFYFCDRFCTPPLHDCEVETNDLLLFIVMQKH